MSKPAIIIQEKLFIPSKYAPSTEVLDEYFVQAAFQEHICTKCDNKVDRPNYQCGNCQGFNGVFKFWSEVVIDGKDYISLPRGDVKALGALKRRYKWDKLPVDDRRANTKLNLDFALTKDLFEYQSNAVGALLKREYGVLKSPPRSGKCLIGNTIVSTSAGIISMARLHRIYSKSPNSVSVSTPLGPRPISAFYQKQATRTVRVQTANGFNIRGTPEHRILVVSKDENSQIKAMEPIWVELKDIQEGDIIYTPDIRHDTPAIWGSYTLPPDLLQLFGYFMACGEYVRDTHTTLFYAPNTAVANAIQLLWMGRYNTEPHEMRPLGTGTRLIYSDTQDFLSHLLASEIPVTIADKQWISDKMCALDQPSFALFFTALLCGLQALTPKGLQIKTLSGRLAHQIHVILSHQYGIVGSMTRVPRSPGISTDTYNIHTVDVPAPRTKRLFEYLPDLSAMHGVSLDAEAANAPDPFVNFDRIIFKQVLDATMLVYDITVPDIHAYYADGIISHNTVMAVEITRRLQLKTLILAHQLDLLKQFITAFQEFTDIADLEKADGRKYITIARSQDDFDKADICLAPYQVFLSRSGKRLLEKLRDRFGLIITDEVHRGNASCYSQVLTSFSAKYRYGLTATPKRKDGLDFIIKKIIGPVVHEVEIPTLKPKVQLIPTDFAPARNYVQWTSAMRWLAEHKDRNKLIVEYAVKDIERGRYILIPVTLTSQLDWLVKQINKRFDEPVAAGFHGALKPKQREDLLEKARAGKIKCVVGRRQMLTGINVPIWDVIIECVPIANPPNLEQEVARCLTPLPNKPTPYIRWLIDLDWGISRSCFLTVFGTLRKLGGELTPKSRAVLAEIYARQNKRGGYSSDEVTTDLYQSADSGEKSSLSSKTAPKVRRFL